MSWRGQDSQDFSEGGEAVVEFIMLTAALIIPLVYLILTLAQLQATVFAVEGAARDVAFLTAHGETDETLVGRHVRQIFSDYLGEGQEPQLVRKWCEPAPCQPGSLVHVEVAATVPLPLIPTGLSEVLQAGIPVSTEAVTVMEGAVLQP